MSNISRVTWGGLAACAVGVALVSRKFARHSRFMELRGKTVLITGGSRGLGLELAREFYGRGAKVAICARDEAELRRVAEECGADSDSFMTVKCDVRNRSEVEQMAAAVTESLGPLDVLVNNAGTIVVGPVENHSIEAFEDAMQTNFWGAVYGTFAVMDEMKRRGGGRIVNITSIGGKIAFPHLLPYSASKFALVGYSEGLRAELAKDNVWVTTVCPGLMRTGSPRNATFSGQHKKEYAWFAISDSIPGISMEVQRAARKIVDACAHADAEVHLGLTAKIGALIYGLAPGVCSEVLAGVNALLPAAGTGFETFSGAESESTATENGLMGLTRLAEETQNQL